MMNVLLTIFASVLVWIGMYIIVYRVTWRKRK